MQFYGKILFFSRSSKRDVCDSHKIKKTKNEKHGQNWGGYWKISLKRMVTIDYLYICFAKKL